MTSAMGLWPRVEGAGMALGGMAVAGFASPGWPWWGWVLGLMAPELAMAGRLLGKRVGDVVQNLAHLYAAPFLLMVLGVAGGNVGWIAAAGLWLAHVGAERAMGWRPGLQPWPRGARSEARP